LESLLQLLKVVADARWGGDAGASPSTTFASPGVGGRHRWVYRGQVLPGDEAVTVQAAITAIDDRNRRLNASGFLANGGRVIYQMDDFTLGLEDD
jgi:hypothetical protein